jgi:pyruvate kinase
MEKEPGIDFHKLRTIDDDIATLAQTAVHMADSLRAPALVVMTRRGYLGGLVASFRPKTSIIYAFTNMSSVRRKLWLHRSVVPFRMDFSSDPEKTVRAAFDKLRERNRLMPGDAVVVVSDIDAAGERVDSIQVRYFH